MACSIISLMCDVVGFDSLPVANMRSATNNDDLITPASTPNSIFHILISLTILTSNHVPAKNIEEKTK